jgi:NADPH:quinone reductase
MLWGQPVEAAIAAMARFGRVVQVGASAGPTAEFSARQLRTPGISILTHINYYAPVSVRAEGFRAVCEMSTAGELVVPVEELPLERVADVWERQQTGPHVKLVIRPTAVTS